MTGRPRIAFPAPLVRFWVGILVLTGLSAVVTVALTHYHHSPYPWDVQLLWGINAEWDLNIFRDRFLHFREPGFWQIPGIPLTYPAASGVALGLLYKLANPLRDYLWLCAAGVVAWSVWFIRGLGARGLAWGTAAAFTFTVVATSWPLLVLFNSANVEGLVAIILGAGLVAFTHRRWTLAATLIGAAGAMKIFPLALLALLLSKRRYKEFAAGLVAAALIHVVSLALLGPTIMEAQRQINLGFRVITTGDGLVASAPGPADGHSLYGIVRDVALLANRRYPPASPPQPDRDAAILRPVYAVYLVIGSLGSVALYFFRIRRLPMLNQILAVETLAVLLPPLSRDYTLVHLLVPFGLLCFFAASRTVRVPGLTACFFCFAILFTAGTFLSFGLDLTHQFRSLSLLALLIVVLTYPFRDPYLELPSERAIV